MKKVLKAFGLAILLVAGFILFATGVISIFWLSIYGGYFGLIVILIAVICFIAALIYQDL